MTDPDTPEEPTEELTFDEAVERAAKQLVDRRFSRALLVIAVICSVFLILKILTVVPSFENMFVEMNIEGGLPALTQWALTPYPLCILVLALAGVITKEFLIPDDRTKMIVNVIYLLAVLSMGAGYVTALFLPMIKLMKQMGG